MIVPGEITSMAPGRRFRAAQGPTIYCRHASWGGDEVSSITIHGIIGDGVDPLDVEDALQGAITDGGPIILEINSPGGVLDDAIFIIKQISAAVRAGHRLVAFVRRACGSAYFVACAAPWIVLDPKGSVGHFGLQPTDYHDEDYIRDIEADIWEQLAATRPNLAARTIAKFADKVALAEAAQKLGFVDKVERLQSLLAAMHGGFDDAQ